MLLPAALRRRFRRPTTYAWCGLALSLVTGVVTYRLLDAAADGAARFGHPIEVAVARHASVLYEDLVQAVDLRCGSDRRRVRA